jgi:hypothetical protein
MLYKLIFIRYPISQAVILLYRCTFLVMANHFISTVKMLKSRFLQSLFSLLQIIFSIQYIAHIEQIYLEVIHKIIVSLIGEVQLDRSCEK